MRVLMLGWEFPPFISGGLGTACYGLTKAMSQIGTDVLFVLPKPVQARFRKPCSANVSRPTRCRRSAWRGSPNEYELAGNANT